MSPNCCLTVCNCHAGVLNTWICCTKRFEFIHKIAVTETKNKAGAKNRKRQSIKLGFKFAKEDSTFLTSVTSSASPW